MKAHSLIIIFALISNLLPAQEYAIPQTELKDIEGNKILSIGIINPEIETLVILWGHLKASDQDELERFQAAWKNSLKSQGVKMIVVCAGSILSKTQLKTLATDRNWEFELYFDYHSEFINGLKIIGTPAVLFFGKHQSLICHNHFNCSGKINLICKNISKNLESLSQNSVRIYDSSKYQCQTPRSNNSHLW